MMPHQIIRIRDLHHTYLAGTPLETISLRGASLEVEPGEIVGIIGPAGAGKSTLLQHCNGLLRPRAAGVVEVDGQDLAEAHTDLRRIRQTVGLVFQHPEKQLFEQLVGDDIAYGPKQMGLPRPAVRERVQWAMGAVGLNFDLFVDRRTQALSGGERRKVALAGVLALRPRLLALDEATTGLDPQAREELLCQLRQLNRDDGTAIILVSSEMNEIAALAGRVVVMVDGTTVANEPASDIFSRRADLQSWGLQQPTNAAVLSQLRERGHDVDPRAIGMDAAREEICKILPS